MGLSINRGPHRTLLPGCSERGGGNDLAHPIKASMSSWRRAVPRFHECRLTQSHAEILHSAFTSTKRKSAREDPYNNTLAVSNFFSIIPNITPVYDSSLHVLFHYPHITPVYYSSFHFLFHYPSNPYTIPSEAVQNRYSQTKSAKAGMSGKNTLMAMRFANAHVLCEASP